MDGDTGAPEPRGAQEEANFIANMRRLREENGWSQGEMAQRMQAAGWSEFHQTTISRMEKGARPVRLGEARGIAGVLGTLVGQMILDAPAAQSLRELELNVAELRNRGLAVGTAVAEYVGYKSVVTYGLETQPTLDEGADASIRERQRAVMEDARRVLDMDYSNYIDAAMESLYPDVGVDGADLTNPTVEEVVEYLSSRVRHDDDAAS